MMNVYTYTPAQRHCREGWATKVEHRVYLDTFWGCGGNGHRLTDIEIESLVLQFNTDDYIELDENARGIRDVWLTYNLDDRRSIPSQHGLQRRYFVRKGSAPDRLTMIENAVEKVREAKREAESAQRWVDLAEQDLARIAAAETGDPR